MADQDDRHTLQVKHTPAAVCVANMTLVAMAGKRCRVNTIAKAWILNEHSQGANASHASRSMVAHSPFRHVAQFMA